MEEPVGISASAGGGAAYGVASVIRRAIGASKLAMKDLSLAVNAAFNLKQVNAQITATKDKIASLSQSSIDLKNTVTSNLSGSVDPSKYGDLADLMNAYKTQTANNSQFTAQEKQAKKLGLNSGLLAQLAASGPDAFDALNGASKGAVAKLNAQFKAYQSSATGGGLVVQNDVYGGQIRAQQAALKAETTKASALNNSVNKLAMAVAKVSGRPVQVLLDGKVVAHSVFSSGQFVGILNELTHHLDHA
jgi:hypothetical protein